MSDTTHVDQNNLKERIIKLVIVGKPAVGKTSLRRSFMGQKFRENYLPTLGADFSLYVMNHGHFSIKTTLWDLSGQQRFSKVHPQYYLGSHGAIVLYDIHSENPEDELISWIDKYLEHTGRYVGPVLILQNKIDLIDSQHQSMMSIKHDKLIQSISIYYHNRLSIIGGRTSAKTGENVSRTLEDFIKEVSDYRDKNLNVGNPLISTEVNHYTRAAYLLTFENMIGPVIINRSPDNPDMDYSQEEVSSVVNLSAGLNLEELATNEYETGYTVWTDPVSIFYYIAFVLENEKARGGFDLYIIGVNIPRDMRYLISGEVNLIQGFLTSKMNEFSEFLNTTDYILSDDTELIRLQQSPDDFARIKEILTSLRDKVDGIIEGKLQE